MAARRVVVDGSNIATEGRTLPSLRQLNEAVLAFLNEYPESDVTVVVDATFGHRIDPQERDEFEEAEANNELVSPPAGAIGRGDAFLLRIADRLVIDRSRRLGVEINIDETTWRTVEPPSPAELPLDEIASRETNEELAAALNELTLPQRRVLLLRYFGELSFEEIAATLDCPLGTALSHCRRGLAALRKLLTTKTI